MRKRCWAAVLCAACMVVGVAARPASAQTRVGAQLSLGTDSDFGLGGRVLFGLKRTLVGLDAVLDGDYFFTNAEGPADFSWVDLNGNLVLSFPVSDRVVPRVGAGLNLAILSTSEDSPGGGDTDTKAGLNLLGAVEFPRGVITPFGELRVVAGGAEQVVFTVGILFGGGRSNEPSR